MNIEARCLAKRMNDLDLSLEKSKNSFDYNRGRTEYENIILSIQFILPSGLKLVEDYLNENGKVVYNRFYKKRIEEEIKKGEKHGSRE